MSILSDEARRFCGAYGSLSSVSEKTLGEEGRFQVVPPGKRSVLFVGILFLVVGIFLLVLTYWIVHYRHPDNPVTFYWPGIPFVVLGLVLMSLEYRKKRKGV